MNYCEIRWSLSLGNFICAHLREMFLIIANTKWNELTVAYNKLLSVNGVLFEDFIG